MVDKWLIVRSGEAIVIDKLLQMILIHSTTAIIVEIDENKLRPTDVPIIEADISKLQKCTGWNLTISIYQTIVSTLEYWRYTI